MSKPTECTTPRVNPMVNHRLLGSDHECQCRFILGKKKCTILANDTDAEGGYVCVGQGMYEISLYLSLDFVVNLKVL